MSDPIKHECGVAIVRLRKPLTHYQEKYGTCAWGLNKLYLLMEKQRNRGQDGTGIAVNKLNAAPGSQYMNRHREAGTGSIDRLWSHVNNDLAQAREEVARSENLSDELKARCPWIGEVHLGHLRYATHGDNSVHVCHPMARTSNWPTRRLMVAGNFNLTNTPAIFDMLLQLGQHPVAKADTVVVMEKIAHFLDEANDAIVRKLKKQGIASGPGLTQAVASELDMGRVLRNAAKAWDGGYFMCGMVGHGLTFALRDPSGIRPGYFYANEDVVSCASERAALVTCFDAPPDDIQEVPPGHALIISHDGSYELVQVKEPLDYKACTFERIYFSRGNDRDIYQERKRLGHELIPAVVDAIQEDVGHSVFSFVPNTAETSYMGLVESMQDYLAGWQGHKITEAQKNGTLTPELLEEILAVRVRQEKAALKDAKLRTFISDDNGRNDLVSHAYDITRGILEEGVDNLIMVDDSIVRGTTLRESLLRILSRLNPKRIIIVSSAPQIRYPDCYGIDMSELGRFIAFEASIRLLQENGQQHIIDGVYRDCKDAVANRTAGDQNFVQGIYGSFTPEEISDKIAEMIRPMNINWDGEIKVIYQTVGGLRRAIPDHHGDWYFTGNFPTPGGNRVVNHSFINYIEKRTGRSY